eukprot:TRINITY_DN4403_c0_g1_i1.p1 TRINITY_DN4403_c0_g1~~TRINITY_DN4403_c0_g1_i1.p1  ORF type:complete len:371 (+),score=136.21 TRINITY_DN4403_c0_g1_i1:132-1244(+)
MSSTSAAAPPSEPPVIRDEDELKRVFHVAESRYEQWRTSTLPSCSEEVSAMRDACLSELLACANAANALQIFSPNETAEDINTCNLRYLLLPYYLGMLEQAQLGDTRAAALREARNYFQNFIRICEAMELLSADDIAVFEREGEPSREQKRNELIAFAKREQKNKAAKEDIARRRQTLQGGGAESEANVEELERELALAVLDDAVMSALKETAMIGQELPMLEYMEQLKQKGELESFREKAEREKQRTHQRAMAQARDSNAPVGTTYAHVTAEEANARGLRLFEVPDTNVRQRLLRPWWRQPTMSLEELADIEMERMVRGGGSTEAPEVPEGVDEESNEADDDEAYARMRAKDDWKDVNPAGWGNRIGQG